MRAIETAKLIGGSVGVYVTIAACTAASGPSVSASEGLQSQGSPVSMAMAQSRPPLTFNEPCDKKTPNPDAGPFTLYAEHAFPGHNAQQLAFVVALGSGGGDLGSGYPYQAANAFVRDGYVAVTCGFGVGPVLQQSQFTSVTFILPQ
jgi:hypothetical protein